MDSNSIKKENFSQIYQANVDKIYRFVYLKVGSKAVAQDLTSETFTRFWEQACRERWRSLALCIKAKLETVRSGISSFEVEFMPHFVIGPRGQTVADRIIPQLEESVKSGKFPTLQLMG